VNNNALIKMQVDRVTRHTVGYRDCYKLFAEFPAQTTFGDIQPAFE
jgi:hypothetical protein